MRATMTTTIRLRCACRSAARATATYPNTIDYSRLEGWSINVDGGLDRCPGCNAATEASS